MSYMNYIQKHKRDIAIIVLLLVVALVTRTTSLGTFLTADEKTWIGRSYEFIRAFKDIRFNDMLQTTHPGVTTLWAAGTTITAKMLTSDIPFTNSTLFHFIKSAQFSIALLNVLAIPCIYVLLYLVFKRRDIALFSAFLIALDPFLIGYSRVIHVDALLGSFLTLAVLSSILYARTLSRSWLITSAVLSAFALLTKFPAVFIFPFILCALYILHPKNAFLPLFLKDRSRDALMWILMVALLIFIIWPALLWVPNPFGNVLQVKRDISIAAVTPHNMTEDYSLNAYHYPATILDRSSPVTFIGMIAAFFALGISFTSKKRSPELSLIALYFFGFILMMTLGAKKGDRYILPVFFALDILAAYGLIWLASILASVKKQQVAILSVICIPVAYLITVVAFYHPYTISYNNPLFPDNLSQELGWGEGLEQVGAWLNTNHPGAIAASWYPGELGAFTNAPVLHINAHEQNQVQFIVLYNNMFGREPSHYANDFLDEYYKKREPVFVVKIAGKEFAWVYEKPSYGKTIGDLDAQTIVVQEVVADYANLSGIRILPATRFGEAKTGTLVVTISRSLHGETVFTKQVSLTDLADATWHDIFFPEGMVIEKGEHLFVSLRVVGSGTPYASIRYSQEPSRSTPIYISRTGSEADVSEKPGSLGVQLLYTDIEGKISNELQTKLLK